MDLQYLKKGDIIENKDGKKMIIERLGDICFTSTKTNFNYYSSGETIFHLKEQDYKRAEPKRLKIEAGKFYENRGGHRCLLINAYKDNEIGTSYKFRVFELASASTMIHQYTVDEFGIISRDLKEPHHSDIICLHDDQSF